MATKIHIVQKFYILNKQNEVEQADEDSWKEWFDTHDNCIDAEMLLDGKVISTAFIGLDPTYNIKTPLVFETRILLKKDGNLHVIEVGRYSTYDEALVGHKRVVEKWKKYSPKLPN